MESWAEGLCRLSAPLCNAIAVERVRVTGSIGRCGGHSCRTSSYIAYFNRLPFAMAGRQFLVARADTVSWPNYQRSEPPLRFEQALSYPFRRQPACFRNARRPGKSSVEFGRMALSAKPGAKGALKLRTCKSR